MYHDFIVILTIFHSYCSLVQSQKNKTYFVLLNCINGEPSFFQTMTGCGRPAASHSMEYGTPGLMVTGPPSFFVNTGFDIAVHLHQTILTDASINMLTNTNCYVHCVWFVYTLCPPQKKVVHETCGNFVNF